jgi:hypothetical protein
MVRGLYDLAQDGHREAPWAGYVLGRELVNGAGTTLPRFIDAALSRVDAVGGLA